MFFSVFCFGVGSLLDTFLYFILFFFGGGYGMGDGKIREANQYCHQLAGESWTRAKGYGRGFLKDLSLPWSPFPKANVLRSTRMLWIATISWSLLRTRTDRGMFQNPSNDDACFTFSQPANRWLPIWPLTIHTCLPIFPQVFHASGMIGSLLQPSMLGGNVSWLTAWSGDCGRSQSRDPQTWHPWV